jgi:hypothetical protein
MNRTLPVFPRPFLNGPGDQMVLAIAQAAHRLGLRGIVRASLGKLYAA